MRFEATFSEHLVRLFRDLFDPHPAHVCLLDLRGKILAVNRAWTRFSLENGLPADFRFIGHSYVDVCANSAETGDEHAKQALTGLLDVIHTGRRKFVMTYPCHAPHEKRWFKLWVELQTPESPCIVVAHELIRAEPIAVMPSSYQPIG